MSIINKNTLKYQVGEVFYYRSGRKTYGGIFLYSQADLYLIALSEEISITARSIRPDDVLTSPLYTLAWFSDIDPSLFKSCFPVSYIRNDYRYHIQGFAYDPAKGRDYDIICEPHGGDEEELRFADDVAVVLPHYVCADEHRRHDHERGQHDLEKLRFRIVSARQRHI